MMQLAEKWLEHPAVVRARTFWRRYRRWRLYDDAMTRALDTNLEPPDAEAIEPLLQGWGDHALTADDPFLWSCVEEISRRSGPVIQLGSGVTTLLLGIFAQRGQKHLWTLEHDRHWANTVRAQLREYGISLTHVITASLAHDGRRVWYNIDIARLPKRFSVAICDGDAVAPTGYPGLLERLSGHLAPGAVIIVRNVRRSGDAKYLTRWAKENGASWFVRKAGEPYVKIVLSGERQAPPCYGVHHRLLV